MFSVGQTTAVAAKVLQESADGAYACSKKSDSCAFFGQSISELTSGLDEDVHGYLRVGGREVDVKLKAPTRVGSAFRTCVPQLSSGDMFLNVEQDLQAGVSNQNDADRPCQHCVLDSANQVAETHAWGCRTTQ